MKCNFYAFVVLDGVCQAETEPESIPPLALFVTRRIAKSRVAFEILSHCKPLTKKTPLSAVIFAVKPKED